ncbi:hypothetical protein J2X36_000519 [Methylobacterium sp. BE186]|nr:hypothetical protein [Methylobacterium sp. BE186]
MAAMASEIATASGEKRVWDCRRHWDACEARDEVAV